jgi:hypothetical protein
MDIFDFLFKIVERFGLIKGSEYQDIYGEMDDWRTKNLNSEKAKDNKLVEFYVKHCRQWYVKLGLALLLIPAYRYVHKKMNPELDQED